MSTVLYLLHMNKSENVCVNRVPTAPKESTRRQRTHTVRVLMSKTHTLVPQRILAMPVKGSLRLPLTSFIQIPVSLLPLEVTWLTVGLTDYPCTARTASWGIPLCSTLMRPPSHLHVPSRPVVTTHSPHSPDGKHSPAWRKCLPIPVFLGCGLPPPLTSLC